MQSLIALPSALPSFEPTFGPPTLPDPNLLVVCHQPKLQFQDH